MASSPPSERYTLHRRIGEGTFGNVFLASDTLSGSFVAIKKINLGDVSRGLPNAALREMRALHELDHPNVVKILDVQPQSSNILIVFECMYSDLHHLLHHLLHL